MEEKEGSLHGVGEESVTWQIHLSITASPQMASTDTGIAKVPLSPLVFTSVNRYILLISFSKQIHLLTAYGKVIQIIKVECNKTTLKNE